jgi:hypothetical protein
MMSDRDDLSDKLTREHTRNPKVQTSRNSIWQYATPSPFFPFRTITINRGDGHTDLLQNRRGPGFPPLTETWAHVSNPGPGPTFECAAFPAPLRQDCARTHCGKPIRLLSRRGAASRCRRPLALHPPPPYYYLTVRTVHVGRFLSRLLIIPHVGLRCKRPKRERGERDRRCPRRHRAACRHHD